MTRLTRTDSATRWLVAALVLALVLTAPFAALVAQVADTGAAVPPPEAHTQFILGIAAIAAVIGREVSSLLVGIWNRAGKWLDGKPDGLKQAVAITLSGVIGLGANAIAAALTHSTNWIVSAIFSLILGVLGTVNAAVTIDATKSKLLAASKGTQVPQGVGSSYPPGYRP
jgi:hypothetical protein